MTDQIPNLMLGLAAASVLAFGLGDCMATPGTTETGWDGDAVPGDEPPTDRLHFELADGTGRVSASDASFIGERVTASAVPARCVGRVSVRVVDDAEMSRLHLEYAEVEGTTDVLTFDLGSFDRGDGVMVLDADIAVCLDEAARQGAARGHSAATELLLYIVHGLLHCRGFDDHEPADAAAMHAEEDRILSAIGVGVVYARPSAGEGPGAPA